MESSPSIRTQHGGGAARAAALTLGGTALLCLAAPTLAQPKPPQQVVKPPVAQAWIDVATFSGMGMPGMGGGQGGVADMMRGMLGGRGAAENNDFGRTRTGMSGRWLDVTLYTSLNPSLPDALQAVPAGTLLAPTLKLQSPAQAKPAPRVDDDTEPDTAERPKGRLTLYWGCGETVRPGQPKVLDLATAKPQELAQFFKSRRATQRGTHSAAGRPVWPSRDDRRLVPDAASLVGDHAFSGQGVPDGFRFAIPAAQDLMPAIELTQHDTGQAIRLEWKALPTARAYFLAAMGAKGDNDMVLWTSSELPDTGFGLLDYQTNPAVDGWLKDKVLLAPNVTQCAVPKGILGDSAMLRMMAYGSELNLAHPPRPADLRQPWEPQWAVKIRVKSQSSALLGSDMPGARGERRGTRDAAQDQPPVEAPKKEEKKPSPLDLLRGVIGR